MSRKERHGLLVVHQVKTKALTLTEAAGRIGLSYRRSKRVWKRYREDGESGLPHRSRGESGLPHRARGLGGNRRLDAALGEALEEIPCWEVTRGVARDWTVAYEGRRLQIEAREGVAPAGARVTVRRRLDGAVAILSAGARVGGPVERADGVRLPGALAEPAGLAAG